jgi:hypothetical protein
MLQGHLRKGDSNGIGEFGWVIFRKIDLPGLKQDIPPRGNLRKVLRDFSVSARTRL